MRAVRLEPGERRLAWALAGDGAAVVATTAALHLPGEEPLPWWRVERATWQPPLLRASEVAEVSGAGREHTVELADAQRLAEAVRARVTGSVVWSRRLQLPGGGGVRLAARRRPAMEQLSWQVVYDEERDAADPEVRDHVARLTEQFRRTVG